MVLPILLLNNESLKLPKVIIDHAADLATDLAHLLGWLRLRLRHSRDPTDGRRQNRDRITAKTSHAVAYLVDVAAENGKPSLVRGHLQLDPQKHGKQTLFGEEEVVGRCAADNQVELAGSVDAAPVNESFIHLVTASRYFRRDLWNRRR